MDVLLNLSGNFCGNGALFTLLPRVRACNYLKYGEISMKNMRSAVDETKPEDKIAQKNSLSLRDSTHIRLTGMNMYHVKNVPLVYICFFIISQKYSASFHQVLTPGNWYICKNTARHNHALNNIVLYTKTSLLLQICFIHVSRYTGIIPHKDEGGEWCFEHHEPHTPSGSFQGEVTIAWLVSLRSCQALDRPKVWTDHKQNV